MLNTVSVPEQFRPLFQKAQEYVSRYFSLKKEDPSKGTIEIFGERYILVRAASMSVDSESATPAQTVLLPSLPRRSSF